MSKKTHTLIITENEEMYDILLHGEGLIEISDNGNKELWYLTSISHTDEVKLALKQVSSSSKTIEDVMNGSCEVDLAYVSPAITSGEVASIEDGEALKIELEPTTMAYVSLNNSAREYKQVTRNNSEHIVDMITKWKQ
jgi:hypothetical protein